MTAGCDATLPGDNAPRTSTTPVEELSDAAQSAIVENTPPVTFQQASAADVLPSITEHDLLDFHKKHFPGMEPPTTFFVDPSTIAHLLPTDLARAVGHHDAEDVEEEGEDDGLGYYPDGVKRTLTDAQIEIFRHSEKIQIERERRLQEEKEKEKSPAQTFDAHVALQAEYAAQQKELKGADIKMREQDVPYAERHKRKWENYIETTDDRHGSMTHRRLARELDGQKASNVSIDYGDDDPDSAVHQAAVPPRRNVVSYADD